MKKRAKPRAKPAKNSRPLVVADADELYAAGIKRAYDAATLAVEASAEIRSGSGPIWERWYAARKAAGTDGRAPLAIPHVEPIDISIASNPQN